MCFVQRFLKNKKGAGKAALAAVLTGAILLLTVAAPCASLHQRLHDDGCAAGLACALCMVVQGQMDCATPPPVLDYFVAAFICLTPLVDPAGIRQVDLRLSPSRAPPLL